MERNPSIPMTRGEAARLANRLGGYFSPGPGGSHREDYLRCPLCRRDVTLADRPYPRCLKAPSRAELAAALASHLLDKYDDSRCPQVRVVRPGSEMD